MQLKDEKSKGVQSMRVLGLQIVRNSTWDALRASAAVSGPRESVAQQIIDAHIGRASPPLTPDLFQSLARAYDLLDDQTLREQVSRALMSRLAVEPQFGTLLVTPFAKSVTPLHELLQQTEAAILFAGGRLREAADVLNQLLKTHPTGFNYLCLGRTLQAVGDIGPAASVLNEGIGRYPRDLFLVMELASLRARNDEYDQANALLDTVRSEFDEERAGIAALQEEIDDAIAKNLLEKEVDKDIYTKDFVIGTWWYYYRSYMMKGEYQDGNVALDSSIRRAIEKLLRQNPDVTTFIDFGAFCGYTIAKLAEEFPGIRFVGIDRTIGDIDTLNKRAFPLPNVEFIGGDTLDYIRKGDFGGKAVIYHTRTACYCYPEYLRQLYAACRDKGVAQVYCAEGMSFSRWYLRFHPLGAYPKISLAARGSTFLHDYKRLLEEAGYRIAATPSVQPWLLLDDRSGFGADHRLYQAVLT